MTLGRLIHTTSQKCPDCRTNLQLRARKNTYLARGEELIDETDYLFCPRCGFEGETEQKKRKLRFDKLEG